MKFAARTFFFPFLLVSLGQWSGWLLHWLLMHLIVVEGIFSLFIATVQSVCTLWCSFFGIYSDDLFASIAVAALLAIF